MCVGEKTIVYKVCDNENAYLFVRLLLLLHTFRDYIVMFRNYSSHHSTPQATIYDYAAHNLFSQSTFGVKLIISARNKEIFAQNLLSTNLLMSHLCSGIIYGSGKRPATQVNLRT